MEKRFKTDAHYNSWITGAAIAALTLVSVPGSARVEIGDIVAEATTLASQLTLPTSVTGS